MNRLLHAEIRRMRKDKIFWAGVLFIAAWCLFVYISQYFNMKNLGEEYTLDALFFNFMTWIGIVMAVFIGLFQGTEYGDGTIRNKLIIGLPRKEIYGAGFLVCTAGGWLILAGAYLTGALVGLPLFGAMEMTAEQFLKYTGIAICLMISYSAVYHMISLLSGSKVRAAVLCILVGFGFLVLSIYIFSELAQPEMIQQYVQTSGGGITEWVKNPAYVDGTKREIYEWLLDVIPTGQAMQVTSSAHRWLRMMACSLGTAVVCCCVGICCFRRRNIK